MKLKEENIKRGNELKVEMKASIERKLMLTSGAEPILKNQYHLCSMRWKMRKKGTASKRELRELETAASNARNDYNHLVDEIYTNTKSITSKANCCT